MQGTTGEVCKNHINHCWNSIWLAPLQTQRKRNVPPGVTRRMLIKLLVTTLEMHDCRSCCAINTREILRNPRINVYGRVWTWSVV
jgi:hypothetical protein